MTTTSSRDKTITLKQLMFGKTSAEREVLEDPRLLREGFLDPFNVTAAAWHSGKFLFLGYKGSGKSAIGEHLRLAAESDSQQFVRLLHLADFPFTPFTKLIEGDIEPESKYPTAWSWLLLLQVFDSMRGDQSSNVNTDETLFYAYEALQHAGLLPSPDFKHSVSVSTKRSLSLALAGLSLGYESTNRGQATEIPFFVERLKLILQRCTSQSRHLIIIDGLDDVLTQRGPQYDSLAALIYETDRLNISFQKSGLPFKIIILCRTDLFEKLPNANKNKMRQDAAISLDWYHDPRVPGNSRLIELINHRAMVGRGTPADVFAEFFPDRIRRPSSSGQDVRRFLLDLTRHTPRDMIALMNYIQQSYTRGRLSIEQLLTGARRYSVDYFVPEIKDELAGYMLPEDIDRVMVVLGAMRKREFMFSELTDQAHRLYSNSDALDLELAARLLFDCSAIGNIEKWPGGTTYYTFKYRNRNSVLNPDKRMILHRGMWKALNLT